MDHPLPPNLFVTLYKSIEPVSRRDSKFGDFVYTPLQAKQGNLHFKALANKQERTFTKKQVMSDLK
ncbi:hypothetical protein [uncultured Streptococcus sp.]|uniref:hypothetical protein n=1 Tax=uncultured Streptococcus sp. TaxID=83427 RepID=UPI0028D533ED|nr:hypothetical protein [uncultured Streptococcus sp.]